MSSDEELIQRDILAFLAKHENKELLRFVIVGSVDDGKSTLIGRLLFELQAVYEDQLEAVRKATTMVGVPIDFSLITDGLEAERAQGITIDAARVFFKTRARDYIIIDAPGHIEFLKNLITGAARAEAALLVIDAHEGIQENSRRHGYMMSMLGIRQLSVLVNKMDLVGYRQEAFAKLETDYRAFLKQVGLEPVAVIPVAGRDGDNIAARSKSMNWYNGPTVLDTLDAFKTAGVEVDRPFRMPVQDVYKFTGNGDDRRIVAGTIESGRARTGDDVVFYPSGKRTAIKTFEAFNRPQGGEAAAGQAAGFTLQQQIYVARGELAALAHEPRPEISSRLRVSLFWLGHNPLVKSRDYLIKIGSARATMRLESIHRVIDASNLAATDSPSQIARHEVAECTLACNRALAFDVADGLAATSRFVIIDDYEIRGGGIVREALPDRQGQVRERVLLREHKWEPSFIAPERRAARFAQRPTLLIITGSKDTDRKGLAKQLESRLFEDGRVAYFLGMGNVLYGVDADLGRTFENRREHIRRLAEVANLMLDAGMILIVSAQELTQEELDLIRTTVDPDRIETVWVGERGESDLASDLTLEPSEDEEQNVEKIRALLRQKGVVFQPW